MPNMKTVARINAISGAIPATDVDHDYRQWAQEQLADAREARIFGRMAERSGIDHRWSVLGDQAGLAPGRFYTRGTAPTTGERMAVYAREAPKLALRAIAGLPDTDGVTHLVVASCTGFIAPGVDQVIARALGLPGDVERVVVGFMGCYAGATALRTRWTRRSLLVVVPSVSAQPAVAGRTTSASSAVFVRKMSCTTRKSSCRIRRTAWSLSASDCAGFSPMQ